MAPGTPETRDEFLARLERLVDAGAQQVRFGRHHHSHVACLEDGAWNVRTLEVSQAEADAFLAEHGRFMPEDAERLSKPASLVHAAGSYEELVAWVQAVGWPV